MSIRERTPIETPTPRGLRVFFRSLAYGYNPPPNTNDPAGCMLWWVVKPDLHLRIIGELAFAHMDEPELASAVLKTTRRLIGETDVQYTVATPSLFPPESSLGMLGEYISERLSYCGLSMFAADDNVLNGWARVHALYRNHPDGTPWLTIHPSCETLIKAIGTAMSEDLRPDDMWHESPCLTALRFGAMSRPAPQTLENDVAIPYGSPAWIMKQHRKREDGHRAFGAVR